MGAVSVFKRRLPMPRSAANLRGARRAVARSGCRDRADAMLDFSAAINIGQSPKSGMRENIASMLVFSRIHGMSLWGE